MSRMSFVAVALLIAAPYAAADNPRYVARWVDSSTTTSDEVKYWQRDDLNPHLGNRPLFDAHLRLRALVDTRLPAADFTGPAVEFIGGDRLPGRLKGYAESATGVGPPVPPHLVVETQLTLDLPGIAGRTQVPVWPQCVRRVVVTESRRTPVSPGTMRQADGRQQTFRSLRWKTDGVDLLAKGAWCMLIMRTSPTWFCPARPPANGTRYCGNWPYSLRAAKPIVCDWKPSKGCA